MAQREVDRVAARILTRARRDVMRRIREGEQRIERVYRDAAAQVRERIRQALGGRVTPDVIDELAEDAYETMIETSRAVTEAGVDAAARQGAGVQEQQARAIFDARDLERAQATLAVDVGGIATEEAQRRIQGAATADNVSLSARIRRGHRRLRREMAETVTRSIRAGETIQMRAERLLDIDDLEVEVPRRITALAEAAEEARVSGVPNRFESVVRAYRREVGALGSVANRSQSIRDATEQLIQDLRTARFEQIDDVVDRWTVERARHQARTIARTETIQAYRDSYVRSTSDKPWVKGYRWHLSSSHPKPDVCDVLANQDLHGLGAGGYPVDGLPSNPHPNDLCFQTAIIDRHHFQRETARVRGQQEPPREWESGERRSGEEWLRSQPERVQRDLLGPTRHRVLTTGRTPAGNEPAASVIAPDGTPRPVHEVLGVQPRQRRTARTSARRAIQRDREGQVQPFPEI